jgi:hypothetical protein
VLTAARFLRGYLRNPARRVVEREVELAIGGESVPATLLAPAGGRPRPGWVVLHGITVPGRRHPILTRFARALSAAGGAVLIPEIDSWKRLEIDPAAADRVIGAAARHLAADPAVSPGGVGVIGFSFGATQALITAARAELRSSIRSVVGFGGYCDLGRTVRFMLLGEHEWNGVRYRAEPDPYGRWIVAANYLTRAPGYEAAGDVAAAARSLAAEAGRRFVFAGDVSLDDLKREQRGRLDPGDRELWDVIAPRWGSAVPEGPAAALADALLQAALAAHPQLDPRPVLPRLDRKVVLAHGHADLLIPFTETLRLQAHLPPATEPVVSITRLFAHSGGAERLRLHEYPLETFRYIRLLGSAFG